MMLAWFFLCLRTGCDVRRVCQVSGLRAVNKKGCQDSGMSRANRIKRKCGIIRQDCREKNKGERVPRDHAGNGRDNQAARSRSYRLSLFFIDFLLLSFETSVTRLARALLSFHGE